MAKEVSRDEEGKFPKGISGNPKGRPKGTTAYRRGASNAKLRKILKSLEQHTEVAIVQLAEMMVDKEIPQTVRMQAAKTILSEFKDVYGLLEDDAKLSVDQEILDSKDKETPSFVEPEVNFFKVVK